MNKIIAAAIAAALVMPAAALAASGPKVKVGGGIQADYRHGQGVSTATGYGSQEFDLRRARLIVNGKVNDLVGFGVTVKGDQGKNASFLDMFGTLNFTPLTKVTVGQFKYEFDMEGRESSFDRAFMDRTAVTNAVAGGVSGNFRDKGVQLSGKMDMGGLGGGYAVGVYQGAGTGTGAGATDATAGGNNKFMYIANLFVMPMPGLKLNGGYMNNDQTPSNTIAPVGTTHSIAYTLGASYTVGPLMARSEYYRGTTHLAAGDATAKGWYVLGDYRVLPDVDVFARYQRLTNDGVGADTNKDGVVDNNFHSTDLGAKYYFAHKGRFGGSNVAVNYMIRKAGADYSTKMLNETGINVGAGTVQPVENVLGARLQVAF